MVKTEPIYFTPTAFHHLAQGWSGRATLGGGLIEATTLKRLHQWPDVIRCHPVGVGKCVYRFPG